MKFETTYQPENLQMLRQLDEASKYLPIVIDAAEKYNLQPSIIAGVISRESAWGLSLRPQGPGGTGDFRERHNTKKFRPIPWPPDMRGFGRGLMQIDFDWHKFAREGQWHDPFENIMYGCQLISQNTAYIRQKVLTIGNITIAGLNETDFIQPALAAYNCGPLLVLTAMREKRDIDYYTTGQDYSARVLDRAGWFQLKGWH